MSYSYLDFKNAVNEGVHGKITSVIDIRAFLNRAVERVNGKLDLKSTIRTASLAPGIYGKQYTYPAPADLKGDSILDIKRQISRTEEFNQTTSEQFDRTKDTYKSSLAVTETDGVSYLNIATELNTDETVISDCEDVSEWTASADATNITLDENRYVNGRASIKYDLNSGATTAVITGALTTSIDISEYKNNEIFVWQYIPLTTALTSFTLKWGSSASDYYSATVTTTHEGLAFKVGWNLLRFTWPTTDTGTPDDTAIDYIQLTINKTALMATSNDWRTDFIVARKGDIHDIVYYSEYYWKTAAGVYIPKSTADTDILVAGNEEFELYVSSACDLAGQPVRLEVLERQENEKGFRDKVVEYSESNPSEKKLVMTSYHNLSSIDGDDDILIKDNNN
jgi:hypothetical protein